MTPTIIPTALVAPKNCLHERVILVTGASGVLGRVAAQIFAAHGATVVLHGRKHANLEPIYDAIEAAGGPQPAILSLDYLSAVESDFKGLADTIHSTFKRLDGIFHAASHIEPLSPLTLQNLTSWQAHTTINLIAPVAVTRACLPMLRRAANPSVTFLSETHALSPKAFWGAFSATKSAIQHTAAVWNDELAGESGLRMKVLVPGPVASHCRAVTHPGELSSEVPGAASLQNAFLLLATADPRLPDATVLCPALPPHLTNHLKRIQ